MSQKSVSIVWRLAAAATATLVLAGPALAEGESRADVLERIKPVGEVTVVGQPQPAAATPATPDAAPAAPEAAAPADAAPAEGAPAEAAAPAAPAAPAADDPAALAQAKGCMACHVAPAPGAPSLGPLYPDVAAKYKGDAAAEDMLVDKVIKGGDGNWDTALPAMPPNPITPEEARTLVKWVLSQ